MSTFQQRRAQRARRAALVGGAGFVAFLSLVGAVDLIGRGAELGSPQLPVSPVLVGLLLVVVIGVPMTTTAELALRGRTGAAGAGMGSGLLLLGWVAIQPLLVGQAHWLHLAFGLLGVFVGLTGFSLYRLTHGPGPAGFRFDTSPA
ncbi:hypothetical protein [Nocardia rhizosphaerae]|uniref:Uncharacterized protein n=1 Tax=Nocardia rhizosphaerae TaxID=1691571 RepID=A0ABV8LAS9_9NOCA